MLAGSGAAGRGVHAVPSSDALHLHPSVLVPAAHTSYMMHVQRCSLSNAFSAKQETGCSTGASGIVRLTPYKISWWRQALKGAPAVRPDRSASFADKGVRKTSFVGGDAVSTVFVGLCASNKLSCCTSMHTTIIAKHCDTLMVMLLMAIKHVQIMQ